MSVNIQQIVDDIIDQNIVNINDYITAGKKLPQICLYYALCVNNIDICDLCLENGCCLDDTTLKLAFLLHEPGLLVLHIKNKYVINNEYVKYFFRYDQYATGGFGSTDFNSRTMYDIQYISSDTKYNYLDELDLYIDPITKKRMDWVKRNPKNDKLKTNLEIAFIFS